MASNNRLYMIGALIALVVVAVPVAVADYFLPHHALLRIVGSETRKPVSSGRNSPAMHDVFYVYAEDIDTHKPWVFQNEDTGFGFPFYFKFNSADVQAAAQSLAGTRGTAVVTYYGWRIQLFSVVPNIVSIKRADPDASLPFPWGYVGFWVVILGGGFWLYLRIRRLFGKRATKV